MKVRMKMPYIAHINENKEIQTCSDHCRNTAAYASESLVGIGLQNTAYLAGLLHDCGKFTPEFKEYICKASNNEPVKKGSVIHTFAGVYYIMHHFHGDSIPGFRELTAEVISYAIGAHHGLFDCYDLDGQNGYVHRLNKQPDYENRAIKNFHKECAENDEINHLFGLSEKEISTVYTKILQIPNIGNDECKFCAGLLSRLITSSVINGDRRDTAEFMGDADFSSGSPGNSDLWKKALINLEQYLNMFPSESDIDKARKELSEFCKAFAKSPSNIYRLNLPTGGGKTLSGLRYALSHAIHFDKKRIIYIAPLISILDQNAGVIRKAVGLDEIILEHHSNIVMDQDEPEVLNRYQLLTETWNSPIIITTLVQFLNTLFSGKTGCIRRMQSLCNSVIIIDEVQTVPHKMLSLFNTALNFLSAICGADIVLCSATQPCLEKTDHPLVLSAEEAVPFESWMRYQRIFKRTDIIYAGRMNLENEIGSFILDLSEKYSSILAVCNKKSEAAALYMEIRQRTDKCCFHLSSGMCMAHRRKTLEEMQKALDCGTPLICISTQVIEAGVDISFSAGIRLNSGLDNIIQTAGRINRNGENPLTAPLYVISCIGETLTNLTEIREAKNASDELIAEFEKNPAKFGNDLSSKESADQYYSILFRHMKYRQQDYPVKGKPTLFDLLSDNTQSVKFAEKDEKRQFFLQQAFAEAGKLFSVMDQNTETILVPYKEGREIISELSGKEPIFNYALRKELLNKAKEYSVNLFEYQIKELENAGALQKICDDSVLVLCNESFYDDEALGFDPKGESGKCDILIL